MDRDENSHQEWGGMSLKVASKRTTNPMSPITNQIILSRRTFTQGGRIPAGSMNLTCSSYQQEGGQEGPPTE